LAIEISLTVPRRHRDRTNPKDPITPIESDGDYRLAGVRSDFAWPVSWLEKIFFLFGARAAGVCRHEAGSKDLTEWPKSILGADRMPGQDDSRLRKPNSARTDRT